MSDQEDPISDARSQQPQNPNDVANFEDKCLKEYLSLQNQKLIQYLTLQIEWSWHIKRILWASLTFTWITILFIGWDWLKFEKYPGLPHTIVGTFFVEIIGLGYIVTKYLFPHAKK